MTKVFIASDTHFNHANIIKYCNRPFKSVEEMNETLISNWNSVVRANDKVFFLGDFGFGTHQQIKDILSNLNGIKEMIMGNHDDSRRPKQWIDVGFKEVSKYPIIYKDFYILSHHPVFMNESMPYLNIHGHTHSTSMTGANFFNASMEMTGYKPIEFNEIIAKVIAANV